MQNNIHPQTAAGQSGENSCVIEKCRENNCGRFITMCLGNKLLVLF